MNARILDLIDFEKVNILLEGFNKTTGFVTAILDLKGNVLSQSGWRQICTQFHRVHPETAKRCTESDTVLSVKMAEGEQYHFYQCLNGLVDVAVPLVINGEHYANLFSGQFFFEEPDREFFIKQAQKYRFPNNEYLESLKKVPVVSKEKVKIAMDFLLDMTQLITEITHQKLEQIELNEAVIKSSTLIDSIVDNSSALIYVTDIEGKFQMVNSKFEKLFDLPKDKLNGKNREYLMSKEIAEQHRNNDLTVIRTKKTLIIEEENLEPDGTHYYLTQKFPLFDFKGEVYAVGGISTDITEKKLADDNVLKNQYYLTKAQEMSKIGTWELDILTNNLSWTEENYKIFGVPLGTEMNLDIFLGCIHPDDKEYFLIKWDNALNNEPYDIEHRIIADGMVKWVREKAEISFDESGKALLAIGFTQDITERKKIEESLRKSQTLLFATGKMAKVGGWEIDLQTQHLTWTDELYRIHEVEEGFQPTVEKAIDFYAPDSKPIILAAVERAIEYGEKFDLELQIITAQGKVLDVHANGEAISEGGNPVRVLGTFQDITERKEAEKMLVESEKKIRQLLESTPLPICYVDKDDKIVYRNKRFIKDIGYDETEVPTLKEWWVKAYPDESYRNWVLLNWDAAVKNASEKGIDIESDVYKVTCKDGNVRELIISGSIINDSFLVTFVDITERKIAESEIRTQLDELRRWHEVMVDREERILELKNEVNELYHQLGNPLKYEAT